MKWSSDGPDARVWVNFEGVPKERTLEGLRKRRDIEAPNKKSTMNTLSRREEEALLKSTKAHALKQCDLFVKRSHTSA